MSPEHFSIEAFGVFAIMHKISEHHVPFWFSVAVFQIVQHFACDGQVSSITVASQILIVKLAGSFAEDLSSFQEGRDPRVS